MGFKLDKSYQRSDWRLRPLPKVMLDYAKKDSSVLLPIWLHLCRKMDAQKKVKLALKMMRKPLKLLEKSNLPRVEVELLQAKDNDFDKRFMD